MAYTYEEVMAKLGDEAQAVPGAIIVFRGKHIVVGEVGLNGGFSVTPEGLSILEDTVEVVAEIKKPRKKKEAVVEDSTELVDDLTLDE